MDAKKVPKRSPRRSQDDAKKEKKKEVKLREVKSAKKGVEVKEWEVVTRPLGEEGETKTAPRGTKTAPKRPNTSMTAPRPP